MGLFAIGKVGDLRVFRHRPVSRCQWIYAEERVLAGASWRSSPSQITLGNGSNDVLDLLARVFVGPGDEVVFFPNTLFWCIPLVTRAVGGVAVVTPATDWGHDLAAMAGAVSDRTRLIFIANPNNPTGT